MPLNPQARQVLDKLAELGAKPLEELTTEEVRKQPTPADAVEAVLKERGEDTSPEEVANVEDRTIPGPESDIAVRIYTPAGDGPFPVLVYFHGGGWVIADLDVYDSSPRALANAAGCIVVSSHYRQAPEHPFPAAHDDAFAAYRWVVANAASLGGDPERIAIAGESAGGNLATTVSMLARDNRVQMPLHQALVYPITNHAMDTESYKENEASKPLSSAGMRWFFERYLPDEAAGNDPRVSPLRGDVSELPPATVITAEVDPLRDEGRQYADKLRDAGIDVEAKHYDGVMHEFFGMGAVIDKSKDAVETVAARLKSAFAAVPAGSASE